MATDTHVSYCTPDTHVWYSLTRDIDICSECWECRARPTRKNSRRTHPVTCPEHDPAYCNQCAEDAYTKGY